LTVGAHTLSVTFSPTDTIDYTPATATVTLTVIPITPTLGLTSNANPVFLANAVTFTASIASLGTPPTGTVNFLDGATPIGSGTVSNGVATFTTTSLSRTVHSITAVYSGDSSYGPATSGVYFQNAVDFTLTPQNNGLYTVAPTGVAIYPILVAPVGSPTMPGAISFTVTGLSVDSTASFSPGTLTAGLVTSTVTLRIQLPGKAALEAPARPFKGSQLPLALCLILLPFAGKLRKAARGWQKLAVLAIVSAALAVGLNGCGSKGSLKSQSYSLTVTATSGGLSHTLPLTLTVQ
jgi:hypothetical protein